MQDRTDAVKEECRKGGMRERMNAGKEECRKGGVQEKRDAIDEGCKFGSEMQGFGAGLFWGGSGSENVLSGAGSGSW